MAKDSAGRDEMKKTINGFRNFVMAALVATAGIMPSCGDPGEGTSGIDLAIDCDEISITAPVNTSFPAGFVIGKIIVTATKASGIQRTQFGNSTIINSTPKPVNIPAADLPVYVSSEDPMFFGTTTPVFSIGPQGGTQETMPTVFFTDENGRLDLRLQFASATTFPATAASSTTNVYVGVKNGADAELCEIQLSAE